MVSYLEMLGMKACRNPFVIIQVLVYHMLVGIITVSDLEMPHYVYYIIMHSHGVPVWYRIVGSLVLTC